MTNVIPFKINPDGAFLSINILVGTEKGYVKNVCMNITNYEKGLFQIDGTDDRKRIIQRLDAISELLRQMDCK